MSIWQTQTWQDMLIASGQSEEYFMIERDIKNIEGREHAAVFVEKRKVSLGEYGLFVIGFQGEFDEDLQESLIELCKEELALFIQIETIDYDMQPSSLEKKGDSEVSFKSGYYKKFIPPHTAVIDLTQSEEDILKVMKPKGRYNIRLAEKKGIVVEQVEKTLENIKIFHELMKETTSRDSFVGNTVEYYTQFLETLEDSQLMFAYFEEKVIAAGIFIYSEDTALYYYGASGNTHRNLMAPYLLQWRAIEEAKKRNCKVYDFLGVASPGEKNSPLSGVTDFKKKLSKDIREVSNSYIYVNKRIKYSIIQVLKTFKK